VAFTVDPRILSTSAPLATLSLSVARLQNDSRWPWLVLVPRRAGLREIEELDPDERAELLVEVVLAGQAVRAVARTLARRVEKLNIAALGNVVSQLHVHVVGRETADAGWPGPVWGFGEPVAYDEVGLDRAVAAAREVLEG
jgi:diadenosine tetraphosphate (Ap4A) HIT family hydrolase